MTKHLLDLSAVSAESGLLQRLKVGHILEKRCQLVVIQHSVNFVGFSIHE